VDQNPNTLDTLKGFYRSRICTSNVSINPLIAACDPIFILVTNLKNIEYPNDRNQFLEDLKHEINAFVHRAQMANYNENIITTARYGLCCLLDETISTSEWSKNNAWIQNNLLSSFYKENYGGESFFEIMNNALENIPANFHLIELLYLCLSFGYAGKYKNMEHGKSELDSLANKLYQIICQYRYTNNKNLFLYGQKSKQLESVPQIKTSKLFSIAIAGALIISGLIYFSIHLKLRNISEPLYATIDDSNKSEDEY
jgi:type VI secretion system protein ImpK